MKRLLILALLVVACSRTVITRARWQSMPPSEKTLVVKTLVGREKAKAAKGGNEKRFRRHPEEYVHRIDDAYAHGERRDVNALFETMGD
jgi:predicted Fe-S protein YdhL (DUF1289 family)